MSSFWRHNTFSGFKFELLANFIGTGWSALIQLGCIPLFVKFLGIEAYGLIGFYLVLQALLGILDLGITPTINRELARYSVRPEEGDEARDLVRTLEIAYWSLGVLVGIAILLVSPWIATHWIRPSSISVRTIRQALMLMAILAIFQWPISFYQGGLMGLRKQVLFNTFKIVATTVSNGGAVLVLWRISPSIKAFLLWQVAASAVQAILIAILLWRSLPRAGRAGRFESAIIRRIWKFAAGMSGITLAGLILMQIDRVFVSKLLSLKIFGYYTLAWAVANGLSVMSGVVFNVIFPRMSAEVAAGDAAGLRLSYHRGSQLMAVIILPLAGVLMFFPFETLQLWIRNNETAASVAPVLSVLIIGSALNALLFLPNALQLAFGWTKLALVAAVLSIALVVPTIFPMTKHFGPVGAATIWAAINLLNMLVAVPIMHRHLLPHEAWGYFGDVGLPLLSTFGVAALCRLIFTNRTSPLVTLNVLVGVWFLGSFVAVLAAPQIRSWILIQLQDAKLQLNRWVGNIILS